MSHGSRRLHLQAINSKIEVLRLKILKDCMYIGDFGGEVGMAMDIYGGSLSFKMAFTFWFNFILSGLKLIYFCTGLDPKLKCL